MIAAALSLLLTPAPDAGAAVRDSVVPVPGVTVAAQRPASEPRRRLPTAFLTELRPGASGRALVTLSEVLSEAVGVRVQQYGGLGAFGTVSLRGAPPGQVSLYLDGSPLTSAAHTVVNVSDMPATAVERVEVYRGVAPLSLGAATPGGAINFVTLSGARRREARLVRGSFDTWEGSGTLARAFGAFQALGHVGYQGSDGDFPYHDDNGTPFNAADDSVSFRANNRFDAVAGLGSLRWAPAGGGWVVARQSFYRKTQGVPGLGAVPARRTNLGFERWLTQLEAAREGKGHGPAVRLRGSLGRERSRFRDLASELGLGRHDTDDRFLTGQAALELEWERLPAGLGALLSGDLRDERARLADAADAAPDPPESSRRTRGAALTLRWRGLGDRALLQAARRFDHQESRLRSVAVGGRVRESDVARDPATPQLGARLSAPLGVELKANWTRAERAPDFLELFGNQGSVVGNPALRPERGENWDAGAVWGWTPRGRALLALEWAHFRSDARDLILYTRNSQSSVRAQNVTRAEIRGEELEARLGLPWGFRASAAWTWQTARDRGAVPFWYGKRLPQRPERLGCVRTRWQGGPLRAALDVQHLGENYLDPYNRYRVPGRTLVGATVSVTTLDGALRVVAEAKNLGDVRAADVGGFPLPGRSYFVALETRVASDPHP